MGPGGLPPREGGGDDERALVGLEPEAIGIIREFDAAKKPVAAICHGPWLLAEADIVRGRTVTCWPSIRTDLRNAGATVVDRESVTDGNLITSRKPGDIPAFTEALMAALDMAPAD